MRQPAENKSRKGGARLAPKGAQKTAEKEPQEDGIPRWMWALICVILGLAVLIGALYFVYIMGFFEKKSTNEAFQPAETEQQPEIVEPEEPDEPVEEDEPVISTGTACTSLTLSQSEVTLDEQGSRIFLTAVAQPMDCTDEIVFESTDEAVVLVDQIGMVTAIGQGEADILVTCGDIIQICHIICEFNTPEPEPEPEPESEPEPEPEPAEPSLSKEDFTLFHPGEQYTLKVENAPAGASVSYVSSNTSVVTVTNAGLVTAVGSGTATITVTVGGVQLKCIARCNLGESTENNGGTAEVADGPCTISHSDVSLFSAGEQFTISLTDANGNRVAGLSWYTSDGSVCSVSSSGVVTAAGKGTATISTTYGGQTYSCIVRCNFG